MSPRIVDDDSLEAKTTIKTLQPFPLVVRGITVSTSGRKRFQMATPDPLVEENPVRSTNWSPSKLKK